MKYKIGQQLPASFAIKCSVHGYHRLIPNHFGDPIALYVSPSAPSVLFTNSLMHSKVIKKF